MQNDNIKEAESASRIQDQVRGCLFGGAVGDALGYPAEFLGEGEIFSRYGKMAALHMIMLPWPIRTGCTHRSCIL